MIGKVVRGTSVFDVLCYLFGPGRNGEHIDPHLVAGFRRPEHLIPLTIPRPAPAAGTPPDRNEHVPEYAAEHRRVPGVTGVPAVRTEHVPAYSAEYRRGVPAEQRGVPDVTGVPAQRTEHVPDAAEHRRLVPEEHRRVPGVPGVPAERNKRVRVPGERNKRVRNERGGEYAGRGATVPDRRSLRGLARMLEVPLVAEPWPSSARPVWHCSVRAAPEDPILTDADWAEVAAEILTETGIAARGDATGCRWVAVRHAADHIHIVATLARADGRNAELYHDHLAVRRACRRIEERYRLRATGAADRTATPHPSRAEVEQAGRGVRAEPARTSLSRAVTRAAIAADSPQAFFDQLTAAGILLRRRRSQSGVVVGYAVALPGHTNRAGVPVYFGGGKLAPDLTLPKLRQRWTEPAPDPRPGGPPGDRPVTDPADCSQREHQSEQPADYPAQHSADYLGVAHAAVAAAAQMRASTDALERAALAAAAADIVHLAAEVTGDRHLWQAADALAYAARQPHGRRPAPTPQSAALLTAARRLATGIGRPGAGGTDQTVRRAVLVMVAGLLVVTEALAAHRAAQRRTAQAASADRSAAHLRAAASSLAPPSPPGRPAGAAALARLDFPAELSAGLRGGLRPPGPAAPRPARRPRGGDRQPRPRRSR